MSEVNLNYDFTQRADSVLQAVEAWEFERALGLINPNTDLNERSLYGNTALILAIKHGVKDIYTKLVENGSDLNLQTAFGMSALHFAINVNDLNATHLLVENGADINAKDIWGRTPLFIGTSFNRVQTTEYLIERRPKLNELTVRNETAYFTANKYGHYSLAQLLEKTGADTTLEPGEFDEDREAYVSIFSF